MEYSLVTIIHLMCASLFIGIVFFEVVILEGIRKGIGNVTMALVEKSLINRAKKIMPWVVATLFISGIFLASHHWSALSRPFDSSFGLLLSIKILLAISVLVHFVSALLAAKDGCMSSRRFEITHISVATHMFFIVVLAKAMFFVSW